MSEAVKLASKLPGDLEVNGVDQLAEELVNDPKTLRAGFVLFDTVKVITDTDTGEKIPVVRIRRFEPLGDADDISAELRAAYFKAVEARTGKTALPLDIVEVVDEPQLEGGPDNVVLGGF